MNIFSHDNLVKLLRRPTVVLALVLLAVVLLSSLFAAQLAPYDPLQIEPVVAFETPSKDHLLGTDAFGRDVYSRLLYGGRVTLMTGLIAVLVGLGCGVPLGLVAGFFPPLEGILMRFNDVLMSLPGILIAVSVVVIFGPGVYSAALGVGISGVAVFARLTRSIVLTLRELEFVEAARAMGRSETAIAWLHILPNCISPIFVFSTLYFSTAVLLASSLSFLGLGAQPPMPEWGAMVSEGRQFLRRAPHLAIIPSTAIFLVVLSLNMISDDLRDILDPRLRGTL